MEQEEILAEDAPVEQEELLVGDTSPEGDDTDLATIESEIEGSDSEGVGETLEAPIDQALDQVPPEAQADAQEESQDVSEATDVSGEPESEPEESDGLVPSEDIPEGAAWYVVHTYSGYENKVKQTLEYRVQSTGMQDRIFRVIVPVEEEVDIKEGQRRVIERRVFPGYVFVQMLMDDEAWYIIHDTPGVTGFVGSGTKPTPLRDEEVERILRRIESEEPTVRVSFREGQRVRIVDGPFTDFHGIVDEIDMQRGKVRLLVSFFGRETPVELDLLQVEKG
ncbi:MAG: transcription termination/antitermination protein NusG [Anaerolineae bacterium]